MMLTIEEEKALVQQILDGDTERYELIVNEYQAIVANLCYRLVGSKLDVEDVVQQVFVELYMALPRFRNESKLSTFIYRITVNVVSKQYKYQLRHPSYDTVFPLGHTAIEGSYEDKVVKEEQQRRLKAALGRLKPEQRTALVLYAFKGFSYNDVADVMQVSLSKVESLIFRAKKNLKKLIES